MKSEVDKIVKLYFQGYHADEAIKIVKPDIKEDVLKRLIKNYEKKVEGK